MMQQSTMDRSLFRVYLVSFIMVRYAFTQLHSLGVKTVLFEYDYQISITNLHFKVANETNSPMYRLSKLDKLVNDMVIRHGYKKRTV